MFQMFAVLKNKKDEKAFLNYANKLASEIYDAELKYVMSELENDLQKTIYLDWWHGGYLWNKEKRAKRYKYVNDYDWNKASGYIMDTASKGMG